MATGADPNMAELNERIDDLRIELTIAEDHGHTERGIAIRRAIHDLQDERDLLPRQREP